MSYWQNKKIVVTGGAGFLGSAVVNVLLRKGVEKGNIVIPDFHDDDLTVFDNCLRITKFADIVIHLAAKVGGILYNKKYPGSMIRDNLLMGINLFEASRLNNVKKMVNVGTTCGYPADAPIPFREEYLWQGYPAEVTAPYGLSKNMLFEIGKGYLKEFGFKSVFLLPVNLYGPGDNFISENAHVIPALIQRFIDAKDNNLPDVSVWGSGIATREFLYISDAAHAIALAVEKLENSEIVNLGSGIETPIKENVDLIAELTNYQGKIIWDKTKPDGTLRRSVDITKARLLLGYNAETDIRTGLENTIKWYKQIKK
ncbi:MAG: NAD-dependent epimerase/dehydratase family protein [Candidatus Cloacimonetes bacterium]|jgi:GDP-L-fucose synthase|nr:NAD-dependent epimerase/dehydratase family protein [Candidatus Cloacimonadota bacterium]